MKPLLLTLPLLLSACCMTAPAPVPQTPTTAPATTAAAVPHSPARRLIRFKDYIPADLLDTVLAQWLNDSHDAKNAGRTVVLLINFVPPNYIPNVPGWTILVSDEDEPRNPPSVIRAGDTEYQLTYDSSYSRVDKQQVDALRAGDPPPPPPPSRIIKLQGIPVVRIDKIQLGDQKDAGQLDISQNRHHNMGGSGATYTFSRPDNAWKVKGGTSWMN